MVVGVQRQRRFHRRRAPVGLPFGAGIRHDQAAEGNLPLTAATELSVRVLSTVDRSLSLALHDVVLLTRDDARALLGLAADQACDLAVEVYHEAEQEAILADLLPRGVATQIFTALLENAASEQGARMSAMDNATRNAGEMIDKLTIVYNRSRQAAITKELIEIVSGAQALEG